MSFSDDSILGKGVGFSEGDIIIDDAGFMWTVEGAYNAAQGLQVLVLTQVGSDIKHPLTGFDYAALVENTSGLTPEEQEQAIQLYIKQALLQDDRVQDILSISYNEEDSIGRSRVYDVSLVLFNEEELSLTLGVSI